MMIVCRV